MVSQESKNAINVQYLLDNGGFLIGSAGLKVRAIRSDYDVVMMKDDFERVFGKNQVKLPIANYFRIQPNNPAWYLPKYSALKGDETIDVIILSSNKDYQIISDAMGTLVKFPTFIVQDKYLRVELFERILIEKGFESLLHTF